jgi:hypothetical protein
MLRRGQKSQRIRIKKHGRRIESLGSGSEMTQKKLRYIKMERRRKNNKETQ